MGREGGIALEEWKGVGEEGKSIERKRARERRVRREEGSEGLAWEGGKGIEEESERKSAGERRVRKREEGRE